MRQSQVVVSEKRAPAGAPPVAVPEKPDGRTRAAALGADADAERTASIRLAAYGLYEARGKTDGHDIDDWLAAETALRSGSGQA